MRTAARTRVVVGLVLCVGCRVAPEPDGPASTTVQTPEPEPEPVEPEPGVLACPVEFGPERESILVAGQPTPIAFEGDVDSRLAAHPAGPGEVFVAVGYDNPWYPDRTTTGASLWRVRCADPSKPELALALPDAEFSWSVLSRDGKHIYFSYRGVHSYAIATGKVEPLIQPRPIANCWMSEAEGSIEPSEEFVQGWVGPNELLVLSGGPCGFEAEWRGEAQVLTDFDDPSTPPKRRARAWVGAVAAGAGDRLWVGNGGECSLEFGPPPSGTPGVWRSEDVGASWTFLPLPGIQAGVAQLWASPSDPDRVLAVTECCTDIGGEGCKPSGAGSLFLTTDGGKTWKKILDRAEDYGIEAVRVDEANHELIAFAQDTLLTRDEGRTWTDSDAKLETPIDPRPRLEFGGFAIEPTEDGLERRALNAAPGSGEIVLRPGQ